MEGLKGQYPVSAHAPNLRVHNWDTAPLITSLIYMYLLLDTNAPINVKPQGGGGGGEGGGQTQGNLTF